MPYNPKKNGAANYRSWMQLTPAQIAALQSIEGADNTSNPNSEQFAQVVHVINGLTVSSSTLASEATLADIDLAIQTPDEVANTKIVQIGAIAESTTPSAVSDGDAVKLWADTFGRLILYGANLSVGAIDVNLVNSALISRLGPITNLSAVTGTGAGSSIDVSNYHNITVHIVSSGTSTGSTLNVEHSLDGTNWAVLYSSTISSNTVTEITVSDAAYKYIRTNIPTYNDGTFTTMIYAGN